MYYNSRNTTRGEYYLSVFFFKYSKETGYLYDTLTTDVYKYVYLNLIPREKNVSKGPLT